MTRDARSVDMTKVHDAGAVEREGSRRRSRVVISNVFTDDNRGGAAITAATINTVRRAYPGCDVSLIAVSEGHTGGTSGYRHTLHDFPTAELLPPLIEVSAKPAGGFWAVLKSVGMLILPTRHSSPVAARVRTADLVIGKGGQLFSANRSLRGIAGFWLAAFPVVYAARNGVPAVFFSVTIGPYPRRNLLRAVVGWVLRRASLVMPRDATSYAEAQALGVDRRRLVQMPDCVLSIAPPSAELGSQVRQRFDLSGVRYGCLTLTRRQPGERPPAHEYVGAIVKAVLDARIVDRIVMCVQTDGATKSDYPAAAYFLQYMQDPRIMLVRDDMTASELSALYAGGLFTIGGRIHSAILSLIGGTPAFALRRPGHMKAESLFSSFGLSEYVIHFDRPPESWAAAIIATVERGQAARAEIRTIVTRLAAESRDVPQEWLRGLACERSWEEPSR